LKLIYISANPNHVIVPILVSIFLFPVLVIITIFFIRIRNIRAREKRIKDWADVNKISKGMEII
jgi:preprotein translocase subunit YajC